jgi:predicted permease
MNDLKFAFRQLLKNPGFTAVAVLTLALGIGANTALFSLVDAVLLKMLPVRAPEELILFNWLSGPRGMARSIDGSITRDAATGLRTSTSFSYPAFERFRDHNQTLSLVFAFAPIEQLNVNVNGQAEIASGQLVSGDYHLGLGVSTSRGRTLVVNDDQANATPVAVISYRYWQRRFSSDADVIGKVIHVNRVPVTVVGVTSAEFLGALQVGQSPDLSLPVALEPRLRPGSESLAQPWFWWLQVMGRLKPGIEAEKARASFESIFQQSALEGWKLAQASAGANSQTQPDVPRLRVSPGGQGLMELRRQYSRPLTILMVVVGMVLLIACANVANLLLSRAAPRQKEFAVRMAIGASRWRIVRQLLTESFVLSILGGALGVLLAHWGKDALLAWRIWAGEQVVLELGLDWRVLGFTAAACLLTTLLFGLAPALRATRGDVTPALKENARSSSVSLRSVLSRSLIVAQVGMSLLLLVTAGLFVRTLGNLKGVDAGFNRQNLLLFRIDPRLSGYEGPQIATLYGRILERIRAIPGVRSATLSRHPLLSGSRRTSGITLQGRSIPAGVTNSVFVNLVEASFLETMEIPLLMGRGLSPRDDERAPKVAVINQMLAQKYFPDVNPVGQRFGFGGPQNSGEVEIVGVARDAKYADLRSETPPTIYAPYFQEAPGQANCAVRVGGEASTMIAAVREAVREIDQDLPLFNVKTQVAQIEQLLSQESLFARLSSFFGLVALGLACIGLYGVMSYAVAPRTNEIGIRMALGAGQRDVVGMVMKESMTPVVIGLAIGLLAALGVTRFIASMLFGLEANDPATISLAALTMVAVSALAGYLPAKRASRVNPIEALRCE